ncbi:MAG TPA: hypothetical protein VG126_18300 [Thermoleophilaceae bacterium]|nr:hypothetical protein [Thermoleophilaceae bacterium]
MTGTTGRAELSTPEHRLKHTREAMPGPACGPPAVRREPEDRRSGEQAEAGGEEAEVGA